MKDFSDIYTETSTEASLQIGFDKVVGRLFLMGFELDQHGVQATPFSTLTLLGETGTLMVGEPHAGQPGKLIVGGQRDEDATITLSGATVSAGGARGSSGHLTLKNRSGEDGFSLDGEDATLIVVNGDRHETVRLEGRHGNLILGGDQEDGDVTLRTSAGSDAIVLAGSAASITAGGDGTTGDLSLRTAEGNPAIVLTGSDASITAGGVGTNGDIVVKDEHDVETIHVWGSSGDIEFLNADVAEEFDVSAEVRPNAGPGTVMTLDGEGALVPCEQAYDQRVLGVVAGAGGFKPGIVLDKRQAANRLPVAMVGKAYCLVDADPAPIAVGDMLTTSARRGHAMKASDRERAFGAVIGKALSPSREDGSSCPCSSTSSSGRGHAHPRQAGHQAALRVRVALLARRHARGRQALPRHPRLVSRRRPGPCRGPQLGRLLHVLEVPGAPGLRHQARGAQVDRAPLQPRRCRGGDVRRAVVSVRLRDPLRATLRGAARGGPGPGVPKRRPHRRGPPRPRGHVLAHAGRPRGRALRRVLRPPHDRARHQAELLQGLQLRAVPRGPVVLRERPTSA